MGKTILKYILKFAFVLFICAPLFSQSKLENQVFEIDEIKIKFSGIKSYEESDLKNLLGSKENEIFSLDEYLKDVERLKKFYFDNGFFDTVVDTNLVLNKKDKEIILNFIIKQKERYVYYEIEYKGIDSIEEQVKQLILQPREKLIYEGDYYSKDTIKLEVTRVLNLLFNNGYATAKADNPEILKFETNRNELKNKVNITLTFNPKLRYVFGSTTINIKSQKYNLSKNDIARELTYSENQIYDKAKVVNSELNLGKITILDNPRIVVDKIDSLNKKIYFVINAVIGNKYDLTPELFGYYIQNYFYIGVGLAFSDNYFFGGGRQLTTRARFYFNSLENNRLVFENLLFQPYLFNNRKISGNWNFGIEYRLDQTSNVTQIKNNFGMSYELPDYTFINRINARWDTQNQRIILKEDIVQDSVVLFEKFDVNFFQSLLGLTLIHNSVNNIQFPSKGNFQSFDFAETGLLGNLAQKLFDTQTLNYFQFTNFNSAYLNLTNSDINVTSVLAGKLLTGIIIDYGKNAFFVNGFEVSSAFVPTETKYLCGGSSSIRGWGARQLGIVADKNIGGNFLLENSVEHRVRPFLDSENSYIKDLGFATFVDFGNVWSEISKFKLNEIALAAGGGIRYYTIIGAIRFDLGFKIYDPQPGTEGGSNWIFGQGCNYRNKYTFQFGIGNTF